MIPLTLMLAVMVPGDVESGPKKDSDAAALKVSFVTGPHEGKEVDIVAERKAEPTVYLFATSDKFSRPVARFMRELDTKIGDANAKALVVAAWTGGDAEKHKDYLPKVQQSLKFEKTQLGYLSTATPEGWGLNSDASLTVVVVMDKKVAAVFASASVNEKDVEKVLAAVKK
jgi:hypothetical protein